MDQDVLRQKRMVLWESTEMEEESITTVSLFNRDSANTSENLPPKVVSKQEGQKSGKSVEPPSVIEAIM